MPLTRQQKEARVAEAEQDLKSATSMVFMTHQALTVEDVEELRDRLHAQDAQLRIFPKRLLKIALKKIGLDFDPMAHEGQLGVVWGSDPVTPAKVVHMFAKEHDSVQTLGGTLEGKLLSLPEVQALALLPSRTELLGKLVGTMMNPVRGFATVLSGVQRQTVYVLSAIAEQKQKA